MKLNYNYSTCQEDLRKGTVLHLKNCSSNFAAIVTKEGPERELFININDFYSTSRFKADFDDKIVILLTNEGEEQNGVYSHFELINVINKYDWEILVRK